MKMRFRGGGGGGHSYFNNNRASGYWEKVLPSRGLGRHLYRAPFERSLMPPRSAAADGCRCVHVGAVPDTPAGLMCGRCVQAAKAAAELSSVEEKEVMARACQVTE